MALNSAGNGLAKYGDVATEVAGTWRAAGRMAGLVGGVAGLGAAALEVPFAETPADYGHVLFSAGLGAAGFVGLHPAILLSVGILDLGVQHVDYTSNSGQSSSGWSGVMAAGADGIDESWQRHSGASACVASACL